MEPQRVSSILVAGDAGRTRWRAVEGSSSALIETAVERCDVLDGRGRRAHAVFP
jgi:hypothetical protein